MNQMMGVNPNQGMGWNPSTGAMAQMGVNPMSSMQGNYDGQNYNMKKYFNKFSSTPTNKN